MGAGVAALGMTAGAALGPPPPALVADAGAAGAAGASAASGQGGGATGGMGAGGPLLGFGPIGQPPVSPRSRRRRV